MAVQKSSQWKKKEIPPRHHWSVLAQTLRGDDLVLALALQKAAAAASTYHCCALVTIVCHCHGSSEVAFFFFRASLLIHAHTCFHQKHGSHCSTFFLLLPPPHLEVVALHHTEQWQYSSRENFCLYLGSLISRVQLLSFADEEAGEEQNICNLMMNASRFPFMSFHTCNSNILLDVFRRLEEWVVLFLVPHFNLNCLPWFFQ